MRGPRRIAKALKRRVVAHAKQAKKRALEKEKQEQKRRNAAEKEAARLKLEAECAELNEYFSNQAQACGKRAIFSVIIAAYNAEEYIQETIENILNQKSGCSHTQIIVVDDGSTDGTADVVKELVD